MTIIRMAMIVTIMIMLIMRRAAAGPACNLQTGTDPNKNRKGSSQAGFRQSSDEALRTEFSSYARLWSSRTQRHNFRRRTHSC